MSEPEPASATTTQPASEVPAQDALAQAQLRAEARVAALRSAVTETCDKIAQLGESAAQELKDASADLGKRLADVEQLGTQLRDSTAETWTALDQGLDAAADELDNVLATTKSKLPR
ncbi:MAG: hypothetical protein IT454_09625 [Planctomycetes bacterium]|nr:hypothetical protein [Planctomycetota bacterium]